MATAGYNSDGCRVFPGGGRSLFQMPTTPVAATAVAGRHYPALVLSGGDEGSKELGNRTRLKPGHGSAGARHPAPWCQCQLGVARPGAPRLLPATRAAAVAMSTLTRKRPDVRMFRWVRVRPRREEVISITTEFHGGDYFPPPLQVRDGVRSFKLVLGKS
jgi:hypothetical protein